MEANELYERAIELHKEKKFSEALEIIAQIKQLDPKFSQAYLLEFIIYADSKSHVRCCALAQRILPYLNLTDPNVRKWAADILDLFGHAQMYLGLHRAALNSLKMSAQMSSKNAHTQYRYGPLIFCANHLENFSAADFRILYAQLKKCFTGIKPFPKKFYEHKKIRIGFLSADFKLHVAMVWAWALVAGLDKNRFETYFYSSKEKIDNVSKYLRENADRWHDISELTYEETAKLIHDDEIDILFDLSGYTKDTRIDVAVYRPATVQISGIGYVNSTGLDDMDYFLTDVYCAGNPEYFTEKFLILPHTHFCYAPITNFEPAAEPPCVKNNFVTFGSFNKWDKITESIFRAWKKILDAVPKSRLILKNNILNTLDERKFVTERLKNFGFDLERVEFRPFTKKHMREYDDIDIALDTFPYTGGVTTCEALYMGVPVVSMFGDRHGSRIGLSILMNIGLGGLAVDSYDAYVQTAVDLANDRNSLSAMRKELRGMMESSPLMDAKTYLRDVQTAFVKILNDARQ